jgi:Ni/Fe-hydrogenase subunit HybB-like protein
LFSVEVLVGVIIPLRMFMSREVRKSPSGLFIASMLVILGVVLNRFNNFITAYNPPYAQEPYLPSIGEISVTLGFIAIEILLYRLFVRIFPIISQHTDKIVLKTKYAIRGAAK